MNLYLNKIAQRPTLLMLIHTQFVLQKEFSFTERSIKLIGNYYAIYKVGEVTDDSFNHFMVSNRCRILTHLQMKSLISYC